MGRSTKVNPAAMAALIEAVSTVYWYWDDLLVYLREVVGGDLVARMDRSQRKRPAVTALLTYMNERFSAHGDELLDLMIKTAEFTSFPHLERLDDGAQKAAQAAAATEALREHVGVYASRQHERELSEKRLAERAAANASEAATRDELQGLHDQFIALTALGPQQRGIAFEGLLRDLFDMSDLAPRGAFVLEGEQIDGYFALDGSDYIVEAKWHNEPMQPRDLREFAGKLDARIDNTLGLFWSYSGFTANAITLNSRRRSTIMLADGSDLMAVLDARIGLRDLLLAKRRHAAQTGEIMITASQILTT